MVTPGPRRTLSDPDEETLDHEAVSVGPATATTAVSSGGLAIKGVAAGRTTATLTAKDPDGLVAEQSFAGAGAEPRARGAADPIDDRECWSTRRPWWAARSPCRGRGVGRQLAPKGV